MNNNELYHYGVPGMRWGVRKSQKRMSSDASEASRLKKKKASEMSNDEIQKLNRRIELEKQHKKLNPGAIAKGILVAGAIVTALGAINKAYRVGQESTKIGKEVTAKYKNAKIKQQNKIKIQQALGRGAVLKRKDLKVSKVFAKKHTPYNVTKLKTLALNPVKRRK